MLSMSLKTLNINLMCLMEKQPFEKNSNSNSKITSKVLKIEFVLSDDEIQFLHSLVNSNFGCYCSRSASLI